MNLKIRRAVKNIIWFFKYLIAFLPFLFHTKNKKALFLLTVDLETAKDFTSWQGEKEAIEHARIARQAVEQMILTSKKFDVPITWLCTGTALIENKQEPLYYFGDLIDGLLSSGIKHEIGSHTFSHLNCQKLKEQEFIIDMKKLHEIFNKKKLPMLSHAFPWNKEAYLSVLKQFGICVARIKRGRFPSKITKPQKREPLLIYQSLEGAPLSGWLIKWGINIAVRKGAAFVWLLHPENFYYPKDKEIIERVFSYIDKKRKAGHLKIITMSELCQ